MSQYLCPLLLCMIFIIKTKAWNDNTTPLSYCGQITLSEFDNICQLAIPQQISSRSVHSTSLVKIHWNLLKLLSGNENPDVSWADSCQKLLKFAHQLSKTRPPQYQCTYQVWWKSTDIYASYHPEIKIRTDGHATCGWTYRHTDNQCDTIPHH